MRKILVIGANGFVGGHLLLKAKSSGLMIAAADTGHAPSLEGTEYYPCNITEYEQVKSAIAACNPDYVINVAAIADIDRAENDRQLAYAVNVTGAANVARVCRETGARYCWFSSDAVFDGRGQDYSEDSPRGGVNYYGQTKELGEDAVLAACPEAIIPRISLVLGFPLKKGNSFLLGLAGKLERGEAISGYTYEIRTPIDVLTLCEAILELGDLNYQGILHIGATESISRYDLTRRLVEKMGRDPGIVKPTSQVDSSRALRHEKGIISVARAAKVLQKTRLKDISETIARAISTKKEIEK